MTADARRELKFQGHIIDSYKSRGGHARKWATELLVGMPDLICSMKHWGVHLAEVKHRPEWEAEQEHPNPLSPKQAQEALNYVMAGGLVIGYVVIESTDAIGSKLCIFNPCSAKVRLNNWVPYVSGSKFSVDTLLRRYTG